MTTPRIRFGLRNFKAFRYLEDFEFKPLTVLAGANSAGKSSIFQSLLLLKQTSLAGQIEGDLKFNGDWVKLGNYETVISDFDTKKQLEFRFQVEYEDPQALLLFPHLARGANGNAATLRFDLELHFDREPVIGTGLVTLREVVMESSLPNIMNEEDKVYVSCTYPMDYPATDLLPKVVHRNLNVAGNPVSIMVSDFWPFEILVKDALGPWLRVPLPPSCSNALEHVRHLIDHRLDYLGPVRADPRPFYPVDEEPTMGIRGEGAIPYLLRKRNDKVRYVPGPGETIREGTLLEAINDWLRHLQVTTSLSIEPLEAVAYTAAMRTPSVQGRSVNLAQVGFGISQLLPVLILGLKNPADGFLLFEQPEIHLHPRLQGGLGDFLLSVARAGRTVVVETHSDHLVHRIRRRIAEDKTGELAKMVQLLFVHAGTEDDPGSYIEPLEVNESGAIVNWPQDFFSESADEAFAILHARRGKRI